jgi:hypothetical protein
MSETSPASRHVMLLILITVLFAAAWSTDSGHKETPAAQSGSNSRSAIAILMQSTAVESPADGVYEVGFADDTEIGCPRIVAHSRRAVTTWVARSACGVDASRSPLVIDEPVEAPLPGQSELPIDAPTPNVAALDIPVEAPIPVVAADPVIAPVPTAAVPTLAERNDPMPVLSTVAWRVKMDYRMTCHCCREYCGIAARKVAAFQRRSQRAVSELAQTLSQMIDGIDWNTRLSSKPTEESNRRF